MQDADEGRARRRRSRQKPSSTLPTLCFPGRLMLLACGQLLPVRREHQNARPLSPWKFRALGASIRTGVIDTVELWDGKSLPKHPGVSGVDYMSDQDLDSGNEVKATLSTF